MKSKINCINEETYEYPLLMVSKNNPNQVILALEERYDHEWEMEYLVGTLLTKLKGIQSFVGEYSDNWIKDKFIPFNGSITLSND